MKPLSKFWNFGFFFSILLTNLNFSIFENSSPSLQITTEKLTYQNPYAGIFINEIMASNENSIRDEDGENSDWIEIYNSTNTSFDLASFYISDNNTKTKFQFPNIPGQIVVPANGYKIIWASGKDKIGHTSWSLSANGEKVTLTAPDGQTVIDSYSFPAQRGDISYGRLPNNPDSLVYFSPASPNAQNLITHAYQGFLASPQVSTPGGVYNQNLNISITPSSAGEMIYYTLDGSDPDPNNLNGSTFVYKNNYPNGPLLNQSYRTFQYSSPIAIDDRSNANNSVSMKASAGKNTPDYFPQTKVRKGTPLRFKTVKPGFLPSEIVTHTYFVFSTPYSLPINSITIPEKDLFDYYNGFYTPGIHYDTLSVQSIYCPRGNYYLKDLFEKNGSFEYFENGQKKISENVVYKIHGGCSTQNPRKSIRLKANDNINFPLFENLPNNRYQHLVVRNGGNEDGATTIRDAFYHEISNKLNFEYMETVPSISFINGEYWGVSFVRERIHEKYVESRTGVNKDHIDFLEFSGGELELKLGSLNHYNSMINFLENNNMALANNYNQAITYFDEDNLIDYLVAQIFAGNNDWPMSNVRMWRANRDIIPGKKFYDGKWRWIFYDVDFGLGYGTNKDHNTLNHAIDPSVENTLIFRKMMQSNTFKTKFLNRFSDVLNSHYLTSRTQNALNNWKSKLQPEMEEHIRRWSSPHNLNYWLDNISIINTFLNQRPAAIYNQFNTFFGKNGLYDLTVISADTNQGTTKVNSIVINTSTPGIPNNYSSWTGKYFKNTPLELKPAAKPGFTFSHWQIGNTTVYDSVVTVNTSSNVTYKIFFKESTISQNPVPSALTTLIEGCKYELFSWNSTLPSGSKPDGGEFVYFQDTDPKITSRVAGFTSGAFNHSSGTRINGKDDLGISFINTGGGSNPTYHGSKIGGLLLAINTTSLDSVLVKFTARTHTVNNQPYGIRLQYREGDLESQPGHPSNFKDFNPIVNYNRGTAAGDSATFSFYLPKSLMNKPYVQLLWRYYRTDINPSQGGNRDELGIDDIVISGFRNMYQTQTNITQNVNNTAYINSISKISGNNAKIEYEAGNAIELKPGFEALPGSVFKATVKKCI